MCDYVSSPLWLVSGADFTQLGQGGKPPGLCEGSAQGRCRVREETQHRQSPGGTRWDHRAWSNAKAREQGPLPWSAQRENTLKSLAEGKIMQNFCLEMSLVKCKCPLGGGKAFQLCLEGAGMAFSLQGLCVALPLSKGCFSKLQVVKKSENIPLMLLEKEILLQLP